ncbi:hypothetical protein BSKO_10522 [Bryopsis sp. KO-2023]|nr:hypothetical protein BSKO_10522 [Bryopsis sp. KO-2023]
MEPGAVLIDIATRSTTLLAGEDLGVFQQEQNGVHYILYYARDSSDKPHVACRQLIAAVDVCHSLDCEIQELIRGGHETTQISITSLREAIPYQQLTTTLTCTDSSMACARTQTEIFEEILQGTEWTASDHHELVGYNTSLGQGVDGVGDLWVQAFGAAAVDTYEPTPPSTPHMITYDTRNSYCLQKQEEPKKRWVAVVCPKGTSLCDTLGQYSCRRELECKLGVGSTENVVRRLPSKPHVVLIGDPVVEVLEGTPYVRCPLCFDNPFDWPFPCDPGATAWDEMDGDLTDRVEVCSKDGVKSLFHDGGLVGCDYNTSVPGSYIIDFKVENSGGGEGSASRVLTVLPRCDEGEILCRDSNICSTFGVCAHSSIVVTSQDNASGEQLFLHLLHPHNVLKGPTIVKIPQGSVYKKCAGAEDSEICELGAAVSDGRMQGVYTLMACPSEECQSNIWMCGPYVFQQQGLNGCKLDTNAPLGTVLRVRFVAMPRGSQLPRLEATRYLHISLKCSEQEFLCNDTCTPIRCDAMGVGPPKLRLDNTLPLVVPYKLSWERYAPACTDGGYGYICKARAWDADGEDLTDRVRIQSITGCGSENCSLCDYELILKGVCSPGVYKYRFDVQDSGGNSAEPVYHEVHIVQAATLAMKLVGLGKGQDLLSIASQSPGVKTSMQAAVAKVLQSRMTEIRPELDDLVVNAQHVGLEVHLPSPPSPWANTSIFIYGNSILQLSGPSLEDTSWENSTVWGDLDRSTGSQSDSMKRLSLKRRLLTLESEKDDMGSSLESISTGFDLKLTEELRKRFPVVLNDNEPAFTTSFDVTVHTQSTDDLTAAVNDASAFNTVLKLWLGEIQNKHRSFMPHLDRLVGEHTQNILEWIHDQLGFLSEIDGGLQSLDFEGLANIFSELENSSTAAIDEIRKRIEMQVLALTRTVDLHFMTTTSTACLSKDGERVFEFVLDTFQESTSEDEEKEIVVQGEAPIESDQKNYRNRRSLQSKAAKSSSSSSRDAATGARNAAKLGEYDGYLVDQIVPTTRLPKLKGNHTQMRTIGERSVIIGGAMLWQDRRPRIAVCSRRFNNVQTSCTYDWMATKRAESALQVERLYNTSSELQDSGLPYGFIHDNDTRFGRRASVYFDIALSQRRSFDLLSYMADGQFLDQDTSIFGITVVAYNPRMEVFGLINTECSMKSEIVCKLGPDAAADVVLGKSHPVVFTTFVVLVAMAAITAVFWGGLTRASGDARRGSSSITRCWDFAILAAQVASLCLFLCYAHYMGTKFSDKVRYDIYESLDFDGGRWTLTKRSNTLGNASVSESWQAREDPEDIIGITNLQDDMKTQVSLYSLYCFVQCVAISLMIPRMVQKSSLNLQGRRVVRTLAAATPHLIDLALALGVVVIGLVQLGNLAVGDQVKKRSSFKRSLAAETESILASGGTETLAYTSESGIEENKAQNTLRILFGISVPIFCVFILMNFFMAILGDAFGKVKIHQETGRTTELKTLMDPRLRCVKITLHSILEKHRREKNILYKRKLSSQGSGGRITAWLAPNRAQRCEKAAQGLINDMVWGASWARDAVRQTERDMSILTSNSRVAGAWANHLTKRLRGMRRT